MRILYIMRHAKSSWKDPTLDDHRRPLKKRGKRDVKEMGRRLAARGITPDIVVSSDARRAVDTAVAVMDALGLAEGQLILQPALYHVSATDLRELIHDLPDAWGRVMLFGHNPAFTELANLFLDPPLTNLPTAGVVELYFDCPTWRDIDRQCLARAVVDYPKMGIPPP